ncbi:MAG: class I SAM-dependent methyltransferase [Xanthomonadales bacterium]|nr:class I SAM-dependent methyltransferase [Xanthomonadales bacterium]
MHSPAADDPALLALFWPFQTGELTLAEDPVLFLGARPGPWTAIHRQHAWQCEQPHRPLYEALQAQRIPVGDEVSGGDFPVTLLLPTRQRDESRALLARAVSATRAGGLVVAAAANRDGARSLQADLEALAGPVHSLSKHKCRVLWIHVEPARINAELCEQWLALAQVCQVDIGQETFWSRPGLFAWDRVDAASALLASQLPPTLAGRVADAGAGWGYLSMQLARQCPGVTTIDLFEANARALAPARRNLDQVLASLAGRTPPAVTVHWHDVAAGLPGGFDAVVCNPPFHQGHGGAEVPHLGQAFIASAAQALSRDGQLWLVANRQLPYEGLLGERFKQVRSVLQQGGYKVLQASGPRP